MLLNHSLMCIEPSYQIEAEEKFAGDEVVGSYLISLHTAFMLATDKDTTGLTNGLPFQSVKVI